MANSVLPNTFQNPNEYVDQAMELLSAEEFKCLTFATRHILGWQDTFVTRQRPMSFTMFERGFDSKETVEKPSRHFGGTGLSRKAIGDALHELVKYKFLVKADRVGDGQIYYLSEEPDWDGLKNRAIERLEKNRKRTAKARKLRPGKSDKPPTSVSETNRISDSQTNQPDYTQLVRLTDNQLDGLTDAESVQLTDERLVRLKESNPVDQTQSNKDSVAPKNGAGASAESHKREPDPIFDAVALHIFEIKDANAEGGRIAKISNWLKGSYDGRGKQKVGKISAPAEVKHVEAFAQHCKAQGITPPYDFVRFVENWRKWASKPVLRVVQPPPSVPPPVILTDEEKQQRRAMREQMQAESAS